MKKQLFVSTFVSVQKIYVSLVKERVNYWRIYSTIEKLK